MSFKLLQIFNIRASIRIVVCFIQHLSINFCNWSMAHNLRSWTEASDSQQLNLPQLCKTPIQGGWRKGDPHCLWIVNKKVFQTFKSDAFHPLRLSCQPLTPWVLPTMRWWLLTRKPWDGNIRFVVSSTLSTAAAQESQNCWFDHVWSFIWVRRVSTI